MFLDHFTRTGDWRLCRDYEFAGAVYRKSERPAPLDRRCLPRGARPRSARPARGTARSLLQWKLRQRVRVGGTLMNELN